MRDPAAGAPRPATSSVTRRWPKCFAASCWRYSSRTGSIRPGSHRENGWSIAKVSATARRRSSIDADPPVAHCAHGAQATRFGTGSEEVRVSPYPYEDGAPTGATAPLGLKMPGNRPLTTKLTGHAPSLEPRSNHRKPAASGAAQRQPDARVQTGEGQQGSAGHRRRDRAGLARPCARRLAGVASADRGRAIPTAGGAKGRDTQARRGKRMLGIPTVTDRVVQQAVAQVLTPIFDPTFSDSRRFAGPTGRLGGGLQAPGQGDDGAQLGRVDGPPAAQAGAIGAGLDDVFGHRPVLPPGARTGRLGQTTNPHVLLEKVALGAGEDQALAGPGREPENGDPACASSKSYWHTARTPAVQQALSNAWLKAQGLVSVKDLWCKARGY